MSTKHHTRHPDRGRSHYPERLAKRGLSKPPRLEELEVLRVRQERREEATGHPWWAEYATTDEPAVRTAQSNPKAEALLRDIFGASVPDDGLTWDTATHRYQYAPNHPLFSGYEGVDQ